MWILAIIYVYWKYYLLGLVCFMVTDLYKLAVQLKKEKEESKNNLPVIY